MKPQPWSYSALSDFKNCPRQFYEKRVAKSVKEEPSEHMIYGNKVHKAFENRMKHGTPLPRSLAEHEEYMARLSAVPGTMLVEQKVALSKSLKPCSFFADDVWWRGVIDYGKISEDGHHAWLIDYKTGKVKANFDQLAMFAVHTFLARPAIKTIDVKFYWTTTGTESPTTFRRDRMDQIWERFTPDLRQYLDAFRADIWQPRQSGLCNGWCPVESCEFWRPKRKT